jgi:type I restriction enzyme, S subunit
VSEVQNAEGAAELRRFKPYPEYRDSGIEWLGKVPAHWQVRRLKSFASVQLSNVDKKSVEGQESVQLCNYVHVYYNERITRDLDFMAATATPEQARRFSLRVGDVLITKDSESWTDIAVPAVVAEDLPGVLCGYHLAHIRPHIDCDGTFLSRAFGAIGPQDQFQISANGITRFGLGGDAIRNGVFAIPPLAEQRAIAAFLDREIASIDALVDKKQRVIELLQENRTALITRVVTKGLNPHIPMRDSGIAWLGDIPAHWEVKQLKYFLQAPLAYGILKPDKYTGADGVPLVRILDVESGQVKEDQLEVVSPEQSREFSRTIVRAGELVVSVVGTIGRSFIVPPSLTGANLSRALARVRLKAGVLPAFLEFVFASTPFSSFVQMVPAGTAQRVLNLGDLAEYMLAIPPHKREQQEIVSWLQEEIRTLSLLIVQIGDAIARLTELRTALISAAVTGKIDVREEVA